MKNFDKFEKSKKDKESPRRGREGSAREERFDAMQKKKSAPAKK